MFLIFGLFLKKKTISGNNTKYTPSLFFGAKRRKIFGIKEIVKKKKFVIDITRIFSRFCRKGGSIVFSPNYYYYLIQFVDLWVHQRLKILQINLELFYIHFY